MKVKNLYAFFTLQTVIYSQKPVFESLNNLGIYLPNDYNEEIPPYQVNLKINLRVCFCPEAERELFPIRIRHFALILLQET